jgi:hypothetical protein
MLQVGTWNVSRCQVVNIVAKAQPLSSSIDGCEGAALLALIFHHPIAALRRGRRVQAAATVAHPDRAKGPLTLAIGAVTHSLARLDTRGVLRDDAALRARRVLRAACGAGAAVTRGGAALLARRELCARLGTTDSLALPTGFKPRWCCWPARKEAWPAAERQGRCCLHRPPYRRLCGGGVVGGGCKTVEHAVVARELGYHKMATLDQARGVSAIPDIAGARFVSERRGNRGGGDGDVDRFAPVVEHKHRHVALGELLRPHLIGRGVLHEPPWLTRPRLVDGDRFPATED